MPSTINYGLRYPALTDTPNGPAQIQDLAMDVDAQLVIVDNRLDVVEPRPRGIVARAERTSVSNASTGAVTAVMSLASFPVVAGRAYRVRITTAPRSDVTGDRVVTELRYTIDGSAPTVASTVMKGMQHFHTQSAEAAMSSDSAVIEAVYNPATSHNVRALLTVWRGAGSGNARLYADAIAVTEVVFEDIGVSVSNSGTSI